MIHFGERLRRARIQANLRQEEVARRAGVSRMTVQRIEAGSIDPRLSTLISLGQVLSLELVLAPASLVPEVLAFITSGGRIAGREAGTSAPPSIVDVEAPADLVKRGRAR